LTFTDLANQIEVNIRFGKVKRKPTDYLTGTILKDGIECGKIYGSYMGFLDFDGVRYWDFRSVVNVLHNR